MTDPGYIHGAHTLVKHLPPDTRTGAIVGVLRGVDAEILLREMHCLDILWLVDDWSLRGLPASFNDSANAVRRQAHRRLRNFLRHVRWLECPSHSAAACVPPDLDFVYLDGDHSRAGLSWDIGDWLPTIRYGGILAGHDYNHPDFPGVKRAVDAQEFDNLTIDGTVWLTTA